MPVAHNHIPQAAPHNAGVNIQLLSDLHLEADPGFTATPHPEADLLVLAGDIGSYQPGSRLAEPDFGLGRFAPVNGWPVPVLYVPGNHEYDGLDFDEAHAQLRGACERLGITWLERETVNLGGIRFIGTTLWADFDAFAPGAADTAEMLKRRDKAFRAADFYLQKTGTTRRGEPMLAPQWRELALECQQWLRDALAAPFGGTTVVITHFAPSLHSADPRYGMRPGTAGFCNSLDELLPMAQLWLHGHLHCAHDYVAGGCRVVANPLGYEDKGEQAGWRPNMLIDCTRTTG